MELKRFWRKGNDDENNPYVRAKRTKRYISYILPDWITRKTRNEKRWKEKLKKKTDETRIPMASCRHSCSNYYLTMAFFPKETPKTLKYKKKQQQNNNIINGKYLYHTLVCMVVCDVASWFLFFLNFELKCYCSNNTTIRIVCRHFVYILGLRSISFCHDMMAKERFTCTRQYSSYIDGRRQFYVIFFCSFSSLL